MAFLVLLLPLAVLALLMRQQQRRLRLHQELLGRVEVGDEVVTTSGIFGTVTQLDDDVVLLEVAPGVALRVAKRAIGGIVPEPGDEDEHDHIDLDDVGGHARPGDDEA
jgi:preprotein translocase subunit YajC